MVNDTTTLNGALMELGETMADNLEAMGVLDADASDGLTTLAGKILDIEPSISGLNLDTGINLHSSDDSCLIGQQVLFWAELTATYDDDTLVDVDLSGVLTGATISFKIGNTVVGTGVTDSDGIAYYTHTFLTAGDYSVSAVFDGTENFDDCVSSTIVVDVTYDITITSDKSILSSANHDVATITAGLSDGTGGVSGEMLSYEILDKNDNVLDSGSGITDSNGEISFTYSSTGVGDVDVVVTYALLQETYAIEDLLFYPKLDRTEQITQIQGSTTVSSGEMSGGSGYLANGFDNTGNWEMTFDAKWSSNSCGIWLIKDTETSRDKNDVLMIPNRVYTHVDGGNVFNQQLYNVSQNTYHTFKLTKNNNTLTIEVNGNSSNLTWSLLNTLTTLSIGVDAWGGTSYIKNIKVKAL